MSRRRVTADLTIATAIASLMAVSAAAQAPGSRSQASGSEARRPKPEARKTYAMNLTKDPTQAPFEYACHEGNYGLANILSAARAEEKAKK
jgi:hypothetical protein